ncbi:right-handed parallel beta-helix repeat-containing protein [Microbulbifer epialgicus]|uniref:Right-handed parallel beta-helix repeat-containing protein n=1 Tax=Microbulbifer epialgicus TaxID=393907 RepID=A0ABV4P473_9GAMM
MNIKPLNLKPTSIAFLVSSVGLVFSSHSFAVSCGDTINTPTLLLEELNCPLTVADPYALTVVGPIGSLRMLGNGKILCDNASGDGIGGVLMTGITASVIGGEIDTCPSGIILEGSGFHSILNIEILNFTENGLEVDSNYNLIAGNTIIGLGMAGTGDGVVLTGTYNTINNNHIEAADDDDDDDGISVTSTAEFTTITLNELENNGDEGIFFEADNTVITYNFSNFNLDNGIRGTSDSNTIARNIVTNNQGGGVRLGQTASGNLLNNNQIHDNIESGIRLAGDTTNNTIKNNQLSGNTDSGINVTGGGSFDNIIKDNTAMDNTPYDLVDVNEDALCTNQANTWIDNNAGTADPMCLIMP